MQEMTERRQRGNVHRNITDISENVGRPLTEKMLDLLLKEKTKSSDAPRSSNSFIYCLLVVQCLLRSSEKVKFRVKLDWSGYDVKQEVHRLYEIPPTHQVLIINDKTVSDQQPIGDDVFEFKPVGQIIYIFLLKNRVTYEGSGIRIRDLLDDDRGATGHETIPSHVYETVNDDGSNSSVTSQSSSSSTRKKEKRKSKKH